MSELRIRPRRRGQEGLFATRLPTILGCVVSVCLALPALSQTGWTPTSTLASGGSSRPAVWAGTKLIVWGGASGEAANRGDIYDPATDTWTPTATQGAPSARYGHTAVWTGAKLIVWGGYTGSSGSLLNSGGIYDPATDTWTATTTAAPPSARYDHTAVWTGSKMIVWGGTATTSLNSGAVYDPATNTWTTMSTIGAPSSRRGHTAAWTGTKMVVWGGVDNNHFNSGGIYDPATDTWTAVTQTGAPPARAYHTAVWTGSKLIVWGGRSMVIVPPPPDCVSLCYPLSYPIDLGDGGSFDPATGTWTVLSTLTPPAKRSGHTAVWTGTKMVVWGGVSLNSGNLGSGGIYDPGSDTWGPTTTTDAPSARSGHSAVWTGARMIIWAGAADRSDGGIYDPGLDSWKGMKSGAPTGRGDHTAVWTGTTMIVWGGQPAGSFAWIYDPLTANWKQASRTNAPYSYSTSSSGPAAAAVWTGSEMLVWGRESDYGPSNAGAYDPAVDTWKAITSSGAPSSRTGHTAVWTGSRLVVWGGLSYGQSSTVSGSGGIYDLDTDTWTATPTPGAPSARDGHSAVWTGAQMIVWGGGRNGSGGPPDYRNDGGAFDPVTSAWTGISTTGAPAARYGHTAVWTGSRMIVWGGVRADLTPLNSGGMYDPATATWTRMTTVGAPSARSGHTAVWTGSKMVVWGGIDDAPPGFRSNSGGIYDPATDTWTTMTMEGAPLPRDSHTAVWTGATMIVWGGLTLGPTWSPSGLTATGGVYAPPELDSTTTMLSSSPNPSSLCEPVTLTAAVTPSSGGTMTFADGIQALGSAAVIGGTASLSTTALNAGTRALRAHYAGDETFLGSASSSLSHVVVGACALGPACDFDQDGIPDTVEPLEGRQLCAKDNDLFTRTRLFAMQQYRDFLGREGDESGVYYWTYRVDHNSYWSVTSRAMVTMSFFASDEFQGSVAAVIRLYFAYFNRIPDKAGLDYWLAQLRAGVSRTAISQAFASSPEFQATYGALDNGQFVTLVYNNVLGRTPDAFGLAYWIGQLDSGAETRGEVMLGFSESSEHRDRSYDRVLVTTLYYAMLRRVPEQAGLDYWLATLASSYHPYSRGVGMIDSLIASPEYHGRFLP